MTDPVRVLVADDQALVRGSFRVLVDTAPDLTVVGEAATGAEAVELAGHTEAKGRSDGCAYARDGRD